ncbi:hypothetical protein [Methanimicrococcus hongohii]|nr:hypothetical protein [Methanimicrococcus sp. Hf6]
MILIIVLVLLTAMMSGCLNQGTDSDSNGGSASGFSSSLDDSNEEENDEQNEQNDTETNASSMGSSSLPDVVVANSSGGGGSSRSSSSPWLASVSNPFIGTWVSDPDELGITLVFTGYSDGTFDYEMQNLGEYADDYPAEGSGAYIVREDLDGTNVMVSYFDFGIAKSNSFTVKSDNVIEVTEFVLVIDEEIETSSKILGETVNFTRKGELVQSDYVDTVLPSNIFMEASELGWGADFPEPDEDMAVFVESVLGRDYYSSLWEFDNEGNAVCTFIGFGTLMNEFGMEMDSKDIPYFFSYVIYDDDDNPYDGVTVLYTEDESGNQLFV